MKLRLQPIRVFCFHQTSEFCDDEIYSRPDWIDSKKLKQFLLQLKQNGYSFISLSEAYSKIKSDVFRIKKYAVLTADDGMLCQLALLPWLEANKIPMTLFINVKNLDGKTCTDPMISYFKIKTKEEEICHAEQLYLTEKQIGQIESKMLTIGHHGYEHKSACELSDSQFKDSLALSTNVLSKCMGYIPFFAYPYGRYSIKTDNLLNTFGLVPVLADGRMNYHDPTYIHREILEEIIK
ncbi:MAG: polysaccharide deacetylase family protein [Bacteroidaceae bacterium]|nr:polysaccharide deacetylase family protein [Bacteroidaceae bacterium]